MWLAARIMELREDGYQIETINRELVNRFGKPVQREEHMAKILEKLAEEKR